MERGEAEGPWDGHIRNGEYYHYILFYIEISNPSISTSRDVAGSFRWAPCYRKLPRNHTAASSHGGVIEYRESICLEDLIVCAHYQIFTKRGEIPPVSVVGTLSLQLPRRSWSKVTCASQVYRLPTLQLLESYRVDILSSADCSPIIGAIHGHTSTHDQTTCAVNLANSNPRGAIAERWKASPVAVAHSCKVKDDAFGCGTKRPLCKSILSLIDFGGYARELDASEKDRIWRDVRVVIALPLFTEFTISKTKRSTSIKDQSVFGVVIPSLTGVW